MMFNLEFMYKNGLHRPGKIALIFLSSYSSDPSSLLSPLENGSPFYMLDMLHGEHGEMKIFFFVWVPRQSVKAWSH